jgi:hypothetical protein
VAVCCGIRVAATCASGDNVISHVTNEVFPFADLGTSRVKHRARAIARSSYRSHIFRRDGIDAIMRGGFVRSSGTRRETLTIGLSWAATCVGCNVAPSATAGGAYDQPIVTF